MLYVFGPIILDGHRFQRIEERIIVQAVHFVRVVLRTETPDAQQRKVIHNTKMHKRRHRQLSLQTQTHAIDTVIDVAARIRFAQRLRLVHEAPPVQNDAGRADRTAERHRRNADARDGACV